MKKNIRAVVVTKEKLPPRQGTKVFDPTAEEITAIARKMEREYMTQPKTHHVTTFIELVD